MRRRLYARYNVLRYPILRPHTESVECNGWALFRGFYYVTKDIRN